MAAFVLGLAERYPISALQFVEANGEPAVWATMGGNQLLYTFDIKDNQILAIYGVLNPDKLTRVRPAG